MNEPDPKKLLIVFTRNPELGKCKTRLAKDIGDRAALDIYTFLLQHTISITKNLNVSKHVYYSVKVRENDMWDEKIFHKKQQTGNDLGSRMLHAFEEGFKEGYQQIIIIGSDMYDLSTQDLEEAFKLLENTDFVIGPAEDGGYYLLGMKKIKPALFQEKEWGTDTVLQSTLADLKNEKLRLLPPKNDIDYLEDLKKDPVFDIFLTKK